MLRRGRARRERNDLTGVDDAIADPRQNRRRVGNHRQAEQTSVHAAAPFSENNA